MTDGSLSQWIDGRFVLLCTWSSFHLNSSGSKLRPDDPALVNWRAQLEALEKARNAWAFAPPPPRLPAASDDERLERKRISRAKSAKRWRLKQQKRKREAAALADGKQMQVYLVPLLDRSVDRSIDWLINWLIGWSIGGLLDWWICRCVFIDCLIGMFIRF